MSSVSAKAKTPEDSDRPTPRRGNLRLIGIVVAIAVLAWFALRNLRSVKIEFWFSQRQAPLIVVILISGLLGALIGFLAMRHKSNRT
jgi:uncharacterized integral membrane protein